MENDDMQRVQALEDLEAIRYLRHRWNEKIDLRLGSADPDVAEEAREWLSRHVTSDVELSSNIRDSLAGAGNVLRHTDEIAAACTFSFHMVGGDIVEPLPPSGTDGTRRAQATWYSFGMLSLLEQQLWVATVWRERYVNSLTGWRIEAMAAEYKFASPYESGWAKDRFVDSSILPLVY